MGIVDIPPFSEFFETFSYDAKAYGLATGVNFTEEQIKKYYEDFYERVLKELYSCSKSDLETNKVWRNAWK